MKRLLATLLLLAAVCSHAATVRFNLTNFFAQPMVANTFVLVTYTNRPTVGSSWMITGNPIRISYTNAEAGTNLLTGCYTLQVPTISWARPVTFCVPDDTNVYWLTDLVTNGINATVTAPPFVTSIIAGTNVTISPTNGRGNVTINASGGGGAGTNVASSYVGAGTNGIVVVTNGLGSNYTVHLASGSAHVTHATNADTATVAANVTHSAAGGGIVISTNGTETLYTLNLNTNTVRREVTNLVASGWAQPYGYNAWLNKATAYGVEDILYVSGPFDAMSFQVGPTDGATNPNPRMTFLFNTIPWEQGESMTGWGMNSNEFSILANSSLLCNIITNNQTGGVWWGNIDSSNYLRGTAVELDAVTSQVLVGPSAITLKPQAGNGAVNVLASSMTVGDSSSIFLAGGGTFVFGTSITSFTDGENGVLTAVTFPVAAATFDSLTVNPISASGQITARAGQLWTNAATGNWGRLTNGNFSLGPTNGGATITLNGPTGGQTNGGNLQVGTLTVTNGGAEITPLDGSLNISGSVTASGNVTCGNSSVLGSVGRGYFNFIADGNLTLTKNAGGANYADLLLGNLKASSVITATNGLSLPQLPWIPTNSIPASSSGVTNWVLLNLTNTINTGGLMCVATNVGAAGSFLLSKPTVTVSTWP